MKIFDLFKRKKIKHSVTWDDITLEKFKLIRDIVEQEDEYIKFNLIEVIYGVDTSNMSIQEVNKYDIDFLTTEIPAKNVKLKNKYTLNGRVYNSNINLTEVKTSQFIDFTNYAKNNSNDFEKLLSVFIIPEGHEYNDGYNMKEVQDDILQLHIAEVQSLSFFMIKQLQAFAIIFQSYLMEEIKTMRLTEEKKNELTEMINKAKDLVSFQF